MEQNTLHSDALPVTNLPTVGEMVAFTEEATSGIKKLIVIHWIPWNPPNSVIDFIRKPFIKCTSKMYIFCTRQYSLTLKPQSHQSP